uniref:Uncharacterized protein n=1 Tax=Anguilla anguilla TaxID=7936 RepID=A0A0E9PIT1_ANGAN
MTLGSEMMTSSLFQILLNKEKAPSWPNLQMSKLMVYYHLESLCFHLYFIIKKY